MQKITLIGVLNITPDSFSDGGLYFQDVEKAVQRANEMFQQGAEIIDVGGESTRPGSQGISAKEELERVIPVIKATRQSLGEKVIISIDTNKSVVAKTALDSGANIINSLGGLAFDLKLASVIKDFNCRLIIYHTRGLPQTMQQGEIVYGDVIGDIIKFFQQQISVCLEHGVKQDQLIIDPGIGFGKTVEQNLEIIRRLDEFEILNLPVLVGLSRKSHLGKLLQTKLNLEKLPEPSERLEGALAETAIAIINGATYIRTHDVLETKKFMTVLEELI